MKGYYVSGGFKIACELRFSSYTNKYYWNIYGHNKHYNTVEEAVASIPSFVKSL